MPRGRYTERADEEERMAVEVAKLIRSDCVF
jgi:hypothetical protein